eukprot:539636_1
MAPVITGLLLIHLILLFYPFECVIYCNNEQSCTSDIGSTLSDIIYGRGYKSLLGSPSSLSAYRGCEGAYSCAHTLHINSSNRVGCYGTSSCINIPFIQSFYSTGAYAVNSLGNSSVSCDATNQPAVVQCRGDRSCTDSTINSAPQKPCDIAVEAAFSFYGATVNAFNGNNLTIDFRGYYAGYNGIIYCYNGSRCHINCHSNACAGLQYICHSGAICTNTINTNALAPNNLSLTPDLIWDSVAITLNNEMLCRAQSTEYTFDNSAEFEEGIFNEESNNIGPICCRARTSCFNAIINYKTSTSTVVCSAEQACYTATVNANIIECSARDACRQANMIGNGMGATLYCFGYLGCRQSVNIARFSTVYCSGRNACDESIIRSDGVNMTVIFAAHYAGAQTTVICNEADYCDVYCLSKDACRSSMGNVLCYGAIGSCSVHCEADTYCPAVQYVTYNPTTLPTSNPTIEPVSQPTIIPTFIPTIFPSTVPSIYPTIAPSSNRLIIPSLYPNVLPSFHPTILLTKSSQQTMGLIAQEKKKPFLVGFWWLFLMIGIVVLCVILLCIYVYKRIKLMQNQLNEVNLKTNEQTNDKDMMMRDTKTDIVNVDED